MELFISRILILQYTIDNHSQSHGLEALKSKKAIPSHNTEMGWIQIVVETTG